MNVQGYKRLLLIAAGTEEHEGLAQALGLIKDTIVQVDSHVNLYEKEVRLREITSKMEPKSLGKIKDGRVFRKEDLSQGRRTLLFEGMVNWKSASGRLKGIMRTTIDMHKWDIGDGKKKNEMGGKCFCIQLSWRNAILFREIIEILFFLSSQIFFHHKCPIGGSKQKSVWFIIDI